MDPSRAEELVVAFRQHYYRLEESVRRSREQSFGDVNVLARIGDELDDYGQRLHTHRLVFTEQEFVTLETNVLILQSEIRILYQNSLDASHLGRPIVIEKVKTGRRGRPRLIIEPGFLRQAAAHRGATKIGRFLGCGRTTVRKAMLEHGIAQPGHRPFPLPPISPSSTPELGLLNHDAHPAMVPVQPDDQMAGLPTIADHSAPSLHSTAALVSPLRDSQAAPAALWSDAELDAAISQLHVHFPKAGISMLHGMLVRLGHNVPKTRISQSLFRLDPVGRVFDRIRIKRRHYSVPGPNSLWHHDGQHGLIRWGIVIHGFIDGYSRLITGLKASNNNLASTVLELFIRACGEHGTPSRLRGDHGVENLKVAAYMEVKKGVRRGSYIWGRSVHNVRIERLWVDVTAQFGHKWAEFFNMLETHFGLDINNSNHLWLLHYLFLVDINADAAFFADGWNYHKIKTKGQASRSPHDMFFFDTIVHGVRGDVLSDGEIETFGVDWEALRDRQILASQAANNPGEPQTTSWVGRAGPPEGLNEVQVDAPLNGGLTALDIDLLYQHISPFFHSFNMYTLTERWTRALAFTRSRSLVF